MAVRTLVFGAGWLGTQWAARSEGSLLTSTDIADEEAVIDEIETFRPHRVINAAGKTGHPNIDSLEGHPALTYRSNLIGPLVLASICRERGLHMTHIGSGCIYSGDGGGAGFSEDDPPNFRGSLYARSKIAAEQALAEFDVLQLRVRLPVSATPAPRNLLTKLLGFDRVVRVANSVTVLEDFWDPAESLILREATGVWNMVNPGVEYHDELLDLWCDRADPDHDFEVIDAETLDLELKARRSNCLLSTAKLEAAGLGMPPLSESLPRLVDAYASRRGDPRAR